MVLSENRSTMQNKPTMRHSDTSPVLGEYSPEIREILRHIDAVFGALIASCSGLALVILLKLLGVFWV